MSELTCDKTEVTLKEAKNTNQSITQLIIYLTLYHTIPAFNDPETEGF